MMTSYLDMCVQMVDLEYRKLCVITILGICRLPASGNTTFTEDLGIRIWQRWQVGAAAHLWSLTLQKSFNLSKK